MAADLFFFLSPVVLRNWFTGLTAMSITHSRVMLMFLFPPSRPAYILNVKPLFFFVWSKEKAWNFILWKCCRGRTDTYVRVANANSVVKKNHQKNIFGGWKSVLQQTARLSSTLNQICCDSRLLTTKQIHHLWWLESISNPTRVCGAMVVTSCVGGEAQEGLDIHSE